MARDSCPRCRRPTRLCYCHMVGPPRPNRWPVHILQHRREAGHALNTGRIAGLGLADCTLSLSGDDVDSSSLEALTPPPVLLYPGPDSRPLSELAAGPARTLLVLDASWKKSRRMLLGSDYLRGLPRHAFTPVAPSRYRIRKAPGPGNLSTLEAIVQALGHLEGDTSRYAPLLDAMDWLIERQIDHMGRSTFLRNYSD